MGFIGSTLVIKLIQLKYKIVILDIIDNNKDEKIYLEYPDITFIQGDINNFTLLEKIIVIEKFDGIIHLAAISTVANCEKNPKKCIKVNFIGTKNILKIIKYLSKKPWFIFASSREVYGNVKKNTVDEKYLKLPINTYGRSKLLSEKLIKKFSQKQNFSILILRFTNIYGNKYNIINRVIPNFIVASINNKKIFVNGGKQIIDFIFIDDVIDIFIKSIKYISANKIIDDFNISTGVGYNLFEIINYIEKLLNKKIDKIINSTRNFDVERFVGDSTKIQKKLNIKNFTSLQKGLEITVRRYLK